MTAEGSFPHPVSAPQGEWERIYGLSDVENLFDLGFWRNLKDIFGPRQRYHIS